MCSIISSSSIFGQSSYILLGFLLIIFQARFETVNGLCADGACTSACRYATKNENAVGHCDINYPNPSFGSDASCVCGSSCLPRVHLATIMRPNNQLACVGAHHQSQCSACPPSTLAQTLVPHVCLATLPGTSSAASQFCMCMCVGPEETAIAGPPSHNAIQPQYQNNIYSAQPGFAGPYQAQQPYQYPFYNNLAYYGKRK